VRNDEIETTLDDAIASYVMEPRSGLADRVLAHVRLEKARSRQPWFFAAAFAMAVACMAVAAVVWWPSIPPRPVIAWTPPGPPTSLSISRRPTDRRPHATRPATLPRPIPLTQQERALLAFARYAPTTALELARPDKPLEIEEITIKPLQIESLDQGKDTGETK
jgi:hypothetical protein